LCAIASARVPESIASSISPSRVCMFVMTAKTHACLRSSISCWAIPSAARRHSCALRICPN
jgi:hypothetical protein